MDSTAAPSNQNPVVTVFAPAEQTVPLVLSSPHSGRDYTPEFIAMSRLDPMTLRRSEDSYIDELFDQAPLLGAPLAAALFPRAFCDPNREPYELDPAMFLGRLPEAANIRSPRVAAGLGTIAKVVSNGAEIYAGRLPVSEIDRRIEGYYRPYHAELARLVAETQAKFGRVVLVDCHSMPSVGGPADFDRGDSRVDVVLGDCFGAACDGAVVEVLEKAFGDLGYRVVRNTPYAGGYTTRHYGKPRQGRHAVQIELNRAMYMDEATHAKLPGFARLRDDLSQVVGRLVEHLRRENPA